MISSIKIFYYEDGKLRDFIVDITFIKIYLKFFSSKIAIISDKHLLFLKKTFPKSARKYLSTLVREEVEHTFQGENFCYYYQIIEERDGDIEVNIWLYNSEIRDYLLEKGLIFQIPEPLLYIQEQPTLIILLKKDYVISLYTKNKKVYYFHFAKNLTIEDFSLFFKNLPKGEEFKCLVYAQDDRELEELLLKFNLQFDKQKVSSTPLFLNYIHNLKLKGFLQKTSDIQGLNYTILLRIPIYVIIALSLNLYVSNKLYEKKNLDLEEEMKRFIKVDAKDDKNLVKVLEDMRAKKQDPFYVLEKLTTYLFQGTYIKRINLTEEYLELSLSTPDPWVAINNLHFEPCFKNLQLTSSIQREDKNYKFDLKIGLNRCKYPEKN